MSFNLIDSSSKVSVTSALNVFETRPTNVSVTNSTYHELLPLNPVTMPPYQFKIAASEHWIDLSKSYLTVVFSLKKKDKDGKWVSVTDDDNVSPIQALGTTFIKNLRVSVNQREIFNANALYSYKSIIDYELSTTKDVKDTYLQSCGYYNDTNDRKKLFVLNKKVGFLTRILADIFNQPLYFMNHADIEIEVIPNDANFNLIGAKDTSYQLNTESIKMYVKTVNLMDKLALDIDNRLQSHVAKYAVVRSELKSQFLSEGRYEYVSTLFTEQIPQRIVIAFVKHHNFIGTIDTDPFEFQHHNIKNISVQANSKYYPNSAYEANWSQHEFTRIFHDMYENCGFVNTSMGITVDSFKQNKCFFVFNLTNDMEIDDTFDLIKHGTTSINVRFSDPIVKGGLTMIIYGEFPGLLCIDKNRVVTSDLSIV
uniref:Uncharacterized protein n=1 Tax=Panagrolaimus sp. JU765 TaxID=591449 RepID=A0AC34RSL0_9BILA